MEVVSATKQMNEEEKKERRTFRQIAKLMLVVAWITMQQMYEEEEKERRTFRQIIEKLMLVVAWMTIMQQTMPETRKLSTK